MKGLQVANTLPSYPSEPVAPPQGKKGTSALSVLLEMEQKWVPLGTISDHIEQCLVGQHLPLLPLRTLDEQQAAKPPALVSDPSSVATNLTYLDSPRKVNSYFMCTGLAVLHAAFEIKYDLALWLFGNRPLVEHCVCRFFKGLLLLFLAFYLHFCPFLCSVPAADLCVFGSWFMLFLYAGRTVASFWNLFVALVPPTPITLRSVILSRGSLHVCVTYEENVFFWAR